ncbi:hypothetical protein AB0M28_14440 [Streptomyces sp. NPDC051940]|uniref:hypothetical protein n=1 Tax=Streptomyces sp. NPDC051940 TaxID=3155675 RepID=UPI003427DC38
MDISMRRSAVSLLAAGVLAGGGLLGFSGSAVAATPQAKGTYAGLPACPDGGTSCGGCDWDWCDGGDWQWEWNWNWNWGNNSQPPPPPKPPPSPPPQPDPGSWGRVISHTTLNIRQQPTTDSGVVGSLEPGDEGPVYCMTEGQSVNGNQWWYWVGAGWSSATYIQVSGPVANC